MEANTFNGFVEKGLGSFRVPSCGEAKVDHLTIRIDGAPLVSQFAADPSVGFIHMPNKAGAVQMFLCSLGEFGYKLLNPPIHGRPIDSDPALCEQIDQVLVGQRVAQVPPHCAQNDITWKAIVFERRPARHYQPQKNKAVKA